MDNYRAIPEGYMRVGELAKKAGISTNALRYYDKEGLLSPSSESEGGYRLYTDKDMLRLTQIITMKQLGFGLAYIKKRLTSLDTPADVVDMLTEHATQLKREAMQLSKSLDEIEALKAEIIQMDAVDFKKIAAIYMTLQTKGEIYWMMKHFGKDIMEMLSKKMSREKAEALLALLNNLYNKAVTLQAEKVTPESEKGQAFAKEFWENMQVAADGNTALLLMLNEQVLKIFDSDEHRDETVMATHRFLKSAFDTYFNLNKMFGDDGSPEKISAIADVSMRYYQKAGELKAENVTPESEKGQAFAKEFWENMLEASGGDVALLQRVSEQSTKAMDAGGELFWETHRFIESALEAYFKNQSSS